MPIFVLSRSDLARSQTLGAKDEGPKPSRQGWPGRALIRGWRGELQEAGSELSENGHPQEEERHHHDAQPYLTASSFISELRTTQP